MGRESPWLWLSMLGAGADIVPVALAVLHGMRGGEGIAVGVKHESGEQARFLGAHTGAVMAAVGGKLGLRGRESLPVDDRLVLAVILRVVVHDLPGVDGVREDPVEVPAAERPVAPGLVGGRGEC